MDPLRAVDGSRLREALAQAGLSNRELARRLKREGIDVKPQTIDYITSDPQQQKRCRESLLRACASTLADASPGSRVTIEWLSGDAATLPFVPSPGTLDFVGAGGRLDPMFEHTKRRPSTREQFVLNGFLQHCYDAVITDFQKRFGRRTRPQFRRWGYLLIGAFAALVEDDRLWHDLLIDGGADPRTHSQASLENAVRFWESALEPWFRGKRQLNMPGLVRLLRCLESGTMLLFPDELDELERRATPRQSRRSTKRR